MGKQRNISDDAELIRKHLLNEMSAEEQEKLDSRIKKTRKHGIWYTANFMPHCVLMLPK